MTITRGLAAALLGLLTVGGSVSCGSSSESRREATPDAGSGSGGSAGDSNATGCTDDTDGCLVGQIMNVDPNAPYDSTNPNRDGQGTFYVVLLDVCPDASTATYAELTERVSVEIDLLDDLAGEFELGFTFFDTDYALPIAPGDTAVLVGFLDDDGSSDGSSAPMPNVGDTITNCVDVELRPGTIGLTMPLAPCFFYTLPEPYFFDQSNLSADCSMYEVSGGGGAGGAGTP